MKAGKILLPAITGTTFMTLFSYLLSELAEENYSEPEHLGTLIHRLVPQNLKKANLISGWVAHYAVGVLFSLMYNQLWEKRKVTPSVKNGFALGGISGAAAVMIWKFTFKMHPAPPWINYRNYYLQLFGAHIVFALAATLTYRLIVKAEVEKQLIGDLNSPRYNVGNL